MKDFYDVIIIDCSDPIGPGEGLFTRDFYKSAFAALRKDGLLVQQTESPIVQQSTVHDVFEAMNDVFPIVRMYYSHVPIYPACLHSFMLASKVYDPLTAEPRWGTGAYEILQPPHPEELLRSSQFHQRTSLQRTEILLMKKSTDFHEIGAFFDEFQRVDAPLFLRKEYSAAAF